MVARHDRQAFELVRTRNEAVTQPPPQAARAMTAPTLAEAALVLMLATHCTLRRPQLK
jgi:hypothetical protein